MRPASGVGARKRMADLVAAEDLVGRVASGTGGEALAIRKHGDACRDRRDRDDDGDRERSFFFMALVQRVEIVGDDAAPAASVRPVSGIASPGSSCCGWVIQRDQVSAVIDEMAGDDLLPANAGERRADAAGRLGNAGHDVAGGAVRGDQRLRLAPCADCGYGNRQAPRRRASAGSPCASAAPAASATPLTRTVRPKPAPRIKPQKARKCVRLLPISICAA